MRSVFIRSSVPAFVLLLALGGCSSTARQDENGGAAGAYGSGAGGGASTRGLDSSAFGSSARPWEDPSNPLHDRVIYFDYDSSEIRADSVGLLRTHAAFLGMRTNQRAILEGHTDERGAREYNLALGDQRAEAVRRFMMAEGVNPNQIETLSYGEERPVDAGHGESSWSQNRRVVIQY